MADHGATREAPDRSTRIREEPEEIVEAIRGGQVDAFVISSRGEPEVYTLVRAQDALRRSEERLELAFEVADIGTWEYDFRTREVTRSVRHDQLFGYDELQPEWSRKIARSHLLPEDRPIFDESFERGAREGRLFLEGRVRRADGRVRWLRTVGRTYYDDEGNPQRMVGVVTDETERRHAADLVRERDRQLAAMADAMPQVVWMARPDGTIDYFNRRITEYQGAERRGGTWYWEGLLHPDDVQKTVESWRRAVEGGGIHEVEHRARMADGSYRWHLSRALPVRDEPSGEIVRWYGTTTDVHDLKRAQAEIRASRDRLEVALEVAEMGTWETDFRAGTSHRSLRHDQIFGYEELQPEWSLEIARSHVLPEDLAAFDRAVEEGERTGKLRHEVRIRRPDGSVRWIYSMGRYYYDEQGERIRRAGVIMDITEEKEAEEALIRLNETLEEQVAARTSELETARDHFETVFHASPTPAAIMHRGNGRLLDVNTEHARFFGYDHEEMIGRTMDELGLWADARDRARIIRRVFRRRGLRDQEVPVRLRDGQERIVLAAVEPIELGEEPCALVMFIDITDRKRAEEAVRQLTSALTLAEQRERRRLSQVLHDDLQQILFGVEMRASMLRQSISSEESAGERRDLARQVDDLRELVGKAVRATRVLSIELNPPVLRGEGLGAALVWLARHMEDMHGLSVEVELDGELAVGLEDQRVLVVQMARELLFNVVKHAGVKQARMTLREIGGSLELRVEDQGIGFDIREMTQQRAHRDSLGLFSVEERLRLFGGTLHIDSRRGTGTRVRIELPLIGAGDGGSAHAPRSEAGGPGTTS